MIHHALPASRFLGLRTLKQDVFISLTCTVMFCALSTSRTVLIWSRLIISTMPGWNSCVVTGSLSIRKHATLGISSHLPSCARLHVSVNALLLPRKTRNLERMMLPKRAGGKYLALCSIQTFLIIMNRIIKAVLRWRVGVFFYAQRHLLFSERMVSY